LRGEFESQLIQSGLTPIGLDEVGRGCLAGPVYAGCVILDYVGVTRLSPADLKLIRDSKTLSAKQRGEAIAIIESVAVHCQTGSASAQEIDELGIVRATFLAMRRCLPQYLSHQHVLLIDGKLKMPDYGGPQHAIVKGDNSCFAIAAAAIHAKEARDTYMREQAEALPHWGFDQHVGYGTKSHLEALVRHGVSPLHRRSFAPISGML
jgi:ribonuclease HII